MIVLFVHMKDTNDSRSSSNDHAFMVFVKDCFEQLACVASVTVGARPTQAINVVMPLLGVDFPLDRSYSVHNSDLINYSLMIVLETF